MNLYEFLQYVHYTPVPKEGCKELMVIPNPEQVRHNRINNANKLARAYNHKVAKLVASALKTMGNTSLQSFQ